MSGPLEGFYSTWSLARKTYGEGTPQTGERFDQSAKFDELKSQMDAAAPGGRWSGKASEAYAAANAEHQRVLEGIGAVDKRLSTQITNAANLVSSGRTDLDTLRKWVTDAAAGTTNDQAGRAIQMKIASMGLGQLADIIKNTDAGMQTVKGNLETIKGEYAALGTGQKFAPGEGPVLDPKDEDSEDAIPEMTAMPPEEQARQDVEQALAGDENAAGRVDEVLTSIKPGQDLTPEQDAYLSQMQSQQKGMSVDDLSEARDNLDTHENIVADSWQLMSNDDVYYSGAGDGKHGTAAQLPDSVQTALNNASETEMLTMENPSLKYGDDLDAISSIVKDGNPAFQTGTELDRKIMFAADAAMDTQDGDYPPRGVTSTVQGLFEAVSDDHQIINDHMMGRNGADADDFLHDVNTTEWLDDGRAAGELFGWTHESSGADMPEHERLIAGQTAEKYAEYIGTHQTELMDIGNQTLGELNPELVREYSHGLTPYMSDIAGLSTDPQNNGFNPLDRDNASERPVAKGIFSVLSTDAQAYNEFHSAANAQVLTASNAWADDVKNGIPVSPNDARMLDAQTLKALEVVGTTNAAEALNLNAADVYKLKEEAYAQGIELISSGVGFIPGYDDHLGIGVDAFADAMKTSIIGEAPDTENYTIARLDQGESARFVLNALLANGVTPVDPGDDLPKEWYDGDVIKTTPGLVGLGVSETQIEGVLTTVLGATVPGGDPTIAMKDQYDDIVENRKPNPAPEPGQ